MLEEFKKFALRGNVIDLAIGVIIGAAFGNIIQSLVGDILMPVVGAISGGLDFSNYFLPLSSKVTADSLVEAKKQGAVLAWGNFLTIALNFLIVAWVLFLLVKVVNRLSQVEAAKAPALTKQEVLLTEIRDALKQEVMLDSAPLCNRWSLASKTRRLLSMELLQILALG
jgi:large conductance mechanosensitive channel